MKIRTVTAVLVCAAAAVAGTSTPAGASPPASRPGAPTVSIALVALQPPTAPVASDITSCSATLNWTSGGGPVRRLRVFQLVDGVWHAYGPLLGPAEIAMPLSGLNPDTVYTFAVQAYATPGTGYSDSPLSEPGSFTTLAGR
jgi:hypothetical protein